MLLIRYLCVFLTAGEINLIILTSIVQSLLDVNSFKYWALCLSSMTLDGIGVVCCYQSSLTWCCGCSETCSWSSFFPQSELRNSSFLSFQILFVAISIPLRHAFLSLLTSFPTVFRPKFTIRLFPPGVAARYNSGVDQGRGISQLKCLDMWMITRASILINSRNSNTQGYLPLTFNLNCHVNDWNQRFWSKRY